MKTQHLITSTYILSILFFAILPSIQAQEIHIPEPAPLPPAVREAFDLDPFYQQWIDVGGFPIVSSEKVSPYALKEAAYLIHKILGHRPDMLQVFAQNRSRFVIIGYDEGFTEIPEYRYLQPSFWFDIRNRGLGSASPYGATSTSEENLLHYPGDVWKENGGSVLIHELAHLVHIVGLEQLDPGFDDRLRRAYEASLKKGLWPGTYGAPDHYEYWAEGVEAWLNPQNTHFVSLLGGTREGLETYDPELAALVRDVYGDHDWRHTRATTRTHLPHLQGFDPQESPTFEYSAEALALNSQLKDPNSTGGGRWIDLEQYPPSELPRLQASRHNGASTNIFIGNYRGDSQDQDVLLYYIAPDGTEHFHQRFRNEMELRDTYVGALWLLKDNDGKTFAVYRAEAETGRILILPNVGPKIEGPWLWMIVPTQHQLPGSEAAASGKDWLAASSNGSVTEGQIATNGAIAGERLGNRVWTSGRLAPAGGDNIGKLVNAIGLGRGTIDHHVAYGSIVLDSPQEQKTRMYAGSDDNHKVWLNGELVNEQLNWNWAHDYQVSVPVTLKKGKNVLLVAVENGGGPWGGYFGFENDAEYSILLPPTREDVNGDNTVNILDLAFVAANFGKQGENAADVNGDNIVNIIDLTLVAAAFGNAAAAPQAWRLHLGVMPTRADVQQWLQYARQVNRTDAAFQRGILILEQLLTALTPQETRLLPNYPNPFNPETWIPYQLAKAAEVTVSIYSIDGKLVRRLALGYLPAGMYQRQSRAAYWDGNNEVGETVASGVYFYRGLYYHAKDARQKIVSNDLMITGRLMFISFPIIAVEHQRVAQNNV